MSSEGDVVGNDIRGERGSSSEGESDAYDNENRITVHMLPEKVKKRLRALKTLQAKTAELEAKFFQEVHLLECRYSRDYKALNDKRNNIVCGLYEPTEDELYSEDPILIQTPEEEAKANDMKDGPGIPEFWLTIFKNVSVLNDMLQPHDEPILKHLQDIKVELLENPMGFRLEFHFSPNEYFSNKILTKEYEMKCNPEDDDPFNFEGPEIYKSKGCKIDWYNGKDVTVKTVKKRQKHRSKNAVRTVTKTVVADSFFNFFTPPTIPDDPNAEMEDDIQATISADFELGYYIRERIVPRAVLYFTGEALDDDDEFESLSDGMISSRSSSEESPSREMEPSK